MKKQFRVKKELLPTFLVAMEDIGWVVEDFRVDKEDENIYFVTLKARENTIEDEVMVDVANNETD